MKRYRGIYGIKNTMVDVWGGAALCFGPSIRQVREVLDSFRWVVTDFGVEHSIASAADCLAAFFHWAGGGVPSSGPPVGPNAWWLPNAIFIPGWSHACANSMETVCQSLPHWPSQLSRVVDYRDTWARALRRGGAWAEAEITMHKFSGSFLHWRWEALPEVCQELQRLRHILTNFWMPKAFGKLEDGALLGEVDDILNCPRFLPWVDKLAVVLKQAEELRLWGTWCPCHDMKFQGECPRRSRRLHEARARVEAFVRDVLMTRSGFDEAAARSAPGEPDFDIHVQMADACGVLVSEVKMRFAWLSKLPYLFANITDQQTAELALAEFEATPNQHRVTKRIMHVLRADIICVAEGGGGIGCPCARAALLPLDASF